MRLLLSNLLHDLAHRITPRQWPCECAVVAYQHGWQVRRDQEMKQLSGVPASPDDLDRWFRSLIADSERPAA